MSREIGKPIAFEDIKVGDVLQWVDDMIKGTVYAKSSNYFFGIKGALGDINIGTKEECLTKDWILIKSVDETVVDQSIKSVKKPPFKVQVGQFYRHKTKGWVKPVIGIWTHSDRSTSADFDKDSDKMIYPIATDNQGNQYLSDLKLAEVDDLDQQSLDNFENEGGKVETYEPGCTTSQSEFLDKKQIVKNIGKHFGHTEKEMENWFEEPVQLPQVCFDRDAPQVEYTEEDQKRISDIIKDMCGG